MQKYRNAGVLHIYVNIEADEAQGKLALDIIHEHGIISEASFYVGGPDETKMGIERALKLAQYFNPDNAQFLPLTPWPHDSAYDEVRQYVRVHDYSKYNLMDPIIEPEEMSLLQVDSAIMNCYRRFYMGKLLDIVTMKDTFKRDYLMRAMKLMMVNPFILKKLGMGSLGKVSAKIGDMMK
jgi:anaerobic magnesium-protoporphyrin IX monomethyl ester cyclase